jgi:two-component system response regulator HydG
MKKSARERSPSSQRTRVLLVDDDAELCEVVRAVLFARGFEVVCQGSGSDAMVSLIERDFDATITDLQMQGMDGIAFCRNATERRPDMPVIVLTGFGSMDAAVSAMRAGAYDFVSKPVQMDDLVFRVNRAVQHKRLNEELTRLRSEIREIDGSDDLLGSSAAMNEVHELVARMKDSDATVLVTGETGTGKELVARATHRRGRRQAEPFVAVNCAAVPETLLESELFGYVKGAFTGAGTGRAGLFMEASGGTLFLDEIGDMPLSMQAKLLRALQERTIRPVGGTRELAFDVRLVCATNRDLEVEIEKGRFREDLYYRINVVRIHMPPLRERGNDVLLIAQHLVERFSRQLDKNVNGFALPVAELLLAYPWPGNVRELANCVERAVVLAQFDRITVDDLPEAIRTSAQSHSTLPLENPADMLTMAEVEKEYIAKVLRHVDDDEAKAAQVLGFDAETLSRKLESHRLVGRGPGT